MAFRQKTEEIDLAGFSRPLVDSTGAMVIKSQKGTVEPILCQSESDVLTNFGYPTAEYPDVFEAIAFCKKAPCWISRAVGDNALHGGVDVTTSTVNAFGIGRNYSTFAYGTSTIQRQITAESTGTGDGSATPVTGTLSNTPITEGSFTVKVNGTAKDITEASGTLSGADVSAGTLDKATGDYSITFSGVAGIEASYTGSVDLSGTPIDTTLLAKPLAFNLEIDGTTYENISTGTADNSFDNADLVSIINTATGGTEASTDVGSGNVKIDGSVLSATSGNIKITDPTDTTTYDSGVAELFDATFVEGADNEIEEFGTDPTGAIPKVGEAIAIDYIYDVDESIISHSFFAKSQYTDDIAVKVAYVSGSKYTITIYKVLTNSYETLVTYNYSLIREKDNFGASLYYEDVFEDDPYVYIKVNSSYALTANPTEEIVDFTGGTAGDEPLTSHYNTSWDYFKKLGKYKSYLFMDVHGEVPSKIYDIISNYQPHGFGLTKTPFGDSDVSSAVSYREGLGIDTDTVALYTNWAKIEDVYNNSFAWVSLIGSVAGRMAEMGEFYNQPSPSGVDDINGLGGQLSDWTVIEMEEEYTESDNGDLYNLDIKQINPIIKDSDYGVMVWGDKTLSVDLTDTSFIGTRRVYDIVIESITKGILKKQVFKNNDQIHQDIARIQSQQILDLIVNKGSLSEAYAICDSTNNTDLIKNQRKFILDVYVKATPNSQEVKLRLTRVSQTQVIAELIA